MTFSIALRLEKKENWRGVYTRVSALEIGTKLDALI